MARFCQEPQNVLQFRCFHSVKKKKKGSSTFYCAINFVLITFSQHGHLRLLKQIFRQLWQLALSWFHSHELATPKFPLQGGHKQNTCHSLTRRHLGLPEENLRPPVQLFRTTTKRREKVLREQISFALNSRI